ncbi:MAG: PriCT-2 domain-containing protein [Pseudomonadota bacterium]
MDCAAREHPAIDAAIARQMLATLADPYVEDDGELELCAIWPDRRERKPPQARHCRPGAPDMDFLAHQNAAGFGLYVGAALRRGAPTNGRASREHIAFTRWVFWIDVDEAAAAEVVLDRLASQGISPTFSVVTGRQPAIRRQCWWRVSAPLSWPEAGRLMERLIAATGADPAPKDPPRVMRLTGFVAWPKPDKPGRVAELVEFEDGSDTTYAASELEAAARPMAPEPTASNAGFHADTDVHGFRVSFGANGETCEAEVAELLSHVSPDLPYSDWLSVLMALHHWNDGEAGPRVAEAWSARGAKYRPGEVVEKWRGFAAGSGHTLATIAKLARDGGADLSEIAWWHGQRPAGGSFPQSTDVTRESKKTASGETCGGEATEDGVARLFAKRHGDTMRFDHDAGRWFRWSGSHWEEDRTGTAFALCRVLARDASGPLSERAQKSARRAAFVECRH